VVSDDQIISAAIKYVCPLSGRAVTEYEKRAVLRYIDFGRTLVGGNFDGDPVYYPSQPVARPAAQPQPADVDAAKRQAAGSEGK
jgi:hypothetical protein